MTIICGVVLAIEILIRPATGLVFVSVVPVDRSGATANNAQREGEPARKSVMTGSSSEESH